jgi:hypothetical protein
MSSDLIFDLDIWERETEREKFSFEVEL